MNYLLKYTKLSRDIIKITSKYIDYSEQNILRLMPKIRNTTCMQLKQGINLFDIMIECVKRGYNGFYINEWYSDIIKIIDDKLYEKNKNIITKKKSDSNYYYEFICLEPGKYYCHDFMTLHEFIKLSYVNVLN